MNFETLDNTPCVMEIDVLCVGHACYDLVFSVAEHPQSDEKIVADNLVSSGGGPAANAAIAISRLGFKSSFAGYLGEDLYGDMHQLELTAHEVNTHCVIRGASPTPLSTVLVKPDGDRSLINYKGSTMPLLASEVDFSLLKAKAILLDGHEPHISLPLVDSARENKIPTILDAGSMHEGTSKLWNQVDYLVVSEKFALQFADDIPSALTQLAQEAPSVVITLGDKGLVWQQEGEAGALPSFSVNAIDTTGAGDAFHGAFAAAVAKGLDWSDILTYSSAAGALCCTQMGARRGLPWKLDHDELYQKGLPA